MKAIVAAAVTAMVLAGGAFATGAALDPRVPGLQRQIHTTNLRITALQGQLAGKLDKACVDTVSVVVRPGYVYQASDGSIMVYKALDEYDPTVDTSFDRLMELKQGC